MVPNSNSITPEFLSNFKSRDLVKLLCVVCGKNFTRTKNQLQATLKRKQRVMCSIACRNIQNASERSPGYSLVQCKNCTTQFEKRCCNIKKSPNNFCSSSCAATYQNQHKTTGYRRSKLEKYLEERIRQEFPDLEFETNCRSVIDYELDFYFPTLNIAVEVNGPTHYRPVYSQEKFQRIQEIDRQKLKLCEEQGIRLVVVTNLLNFTIQLGSDCFSSLVAGGGFEPPIF